MITEENPVMRALRRSQTSSPSSNSSSSSPSSSSSSSSSWIHLRSVLLVVASSSSSSSSPSSSQSQSQSSSSSSPIPTDRGTLKSPWSRKRRKHALLPKQWNRFFTPDGRLSDGGAKFLKKVRSGGIDPSIRKEVWPFLLGVYDMNSTQEERDLIKEQKRREYGSLRKQCKQILKRSEKSLKSKETSGISSNEGSGDFSQVLDSSCSEDMASASRSPLIFGRTLTEDPDPPIWDQALQSPSLLEEDGDKSGLTCEDASAGDTESSDSDSSEEPEDMQPLLATKGSEENYLDEPAKQNSSSTDIENKSPSNTENKPKPFNAEDFAKWQRIIRLDALRANDEWIAYSPSQSAVSEIKAHQLADSVGLKEYDHLEPCRVFHAARMVAILEAYALHDPEIGYCQGMSDLLDPIITVFEEDHEAFWCFVGFMKKARHNFRLDEVGIQRQLKIVSKIIQRKDIHLYRHLEKLKAEDCFFVYRMVIVLFRRELSFEQTLCLWEVIWADQAAIRAGTAKSTWGRIRLRAPPNEDLLLYAISACVLQKRKLIIEKYSSMDEIMRECNSMAGRLDVWKLLDDAHDLVVTLHDKI
ncbi:rab GTPase-activating protein 22-like isoform X2 [Quercus robur]|uniref:rab GTPase-activating protein 22-like isoform X2 n=1 Tax=Quercus robur TaxID=38942 RepID=UPI002163FAD0|nr:rab GTPase-activating protein 22-like isoform X2 [Quercus robur]